MGRLTVALNMFVLRSLYGRRLEWEVRMLRMCVYGQIMARMCEQEYGMDRLWPWKMCAEGLEICWFAYGLEGESGHFPDMFNWACNAASNCAAATRSAQL